MSAAPSTPADVIIKLVQSIADQAESRGRMATQGSGQTAYTALVYTDLDLGLPQPTIIPKNAPATLCRRAARFGAAAGNRVERL